MASEEFVGQCSYQSIAGSHGSWWHINCGPILFKNGGLWMKTRSSWVAVLSSAVIVAGCGGGGGGGSAGASVAVATEEDKAVAMLAVGLFDAVAGVERLITQAGGFPVLTGAAGNQVNGACPGGGTVTVQKTVAATAAVTAVNCLLRVDDGLVYNGAWVFTITGNTFPPNGVCPVATSCLFNANLDISTARFGYGTATEGVVGAFYTAQVFANGTRTVGAFAPGQAMTFDGLSGILNASIENSTFDIGAIRVIGVLGTAARDVLQVTAPYTGTVTLGASIAAALDRNGDGAVDVNFTIPWADMVD